MKKLFLALLIMLALAISASAHQINTGQSYSYEWTIINTVTGDVISSGSDTVIPATDRGYRSVEHYIRSAVMGWKSNTRTVDGVRQRIYIRLEGGGECDAD